MKRVDKTSSVPLYLQLSAIIEEMIHSGELVDGAFLMPERELCKLQEVSRMTVNKAIMKLVNEGLLSRHQGKGTIITMNKETSRYERLFSLSEAMAKKGIAVKNDLLLFEKQAFSPLVVRRLKMERADGFQILRRRYFEGEPVILENIFLNPDMVPGLTLGLVQDKSLYEIFHKRYGHQLVRAEQTIKPIQISEEQGRLLGQKAGILALQVDRVVFTDKEEVMEYTKTIFLTQKHDFEIVLNR